MNNCEIIEQYGKSVSETPSFTRIGCRGLIIENGKILLSHEINTGAYLIPGGGLEADESFKECCKREVLEETGYIVETGRQFITVNEYYYDKLYISHYFPCKIVGNAKQILTENEIEHGVTPEWVGIEKALEIFGKYEEITEENEELAAQYKREFTVISKFIEK